jgi:hypothetical protein
MSDGAVLTGAKAPTFFRVLTARLKLCPDTDHRLMETFQGSVQSFSTKERA